MKPVDRAMMSVSGTPGSGAITLNVLVSGAQTFASAGVVDGDYVKYVAVDGSAWEVGWGKYTSSGTSLSRNLISSSTGSLLSLSSNTVVAITPGAADVSKGMVNRIINGDMAIDQRNAGASVSFGTGGDKFVTDRWHGSHNTSTGTLSMQQIAIAWAGCNAKYALRATVGTAQAVLSAGHYSETYQRIEGVNTKDLKWGTAAARGIFVDFWAQCSVAGTYTAALTNGASNAFCHNFVLAANTPTRVAFYVPGPTTGTWATDNTSAVALNVSWAVGSTYQTATLDTWLAGQFFYSTTASNLLATAGATFDLTDVQFVAANAPVEFERRTYAHEFMLCQRYFESNFPYGTAPANNITTVYYPATAFNTDGVSTAIFFSVPKRTAPTMTFYGSGSASGSSWAYYSGGTWLPSTSISATNTSTREACVNVVKLATFTAGSANLTSGGWTADAEL